MSSTVKIHTGVESCVSTIVASGVTLAACRNASDADAVAYRIAAITVHKSMIGGATAKSIAVGVQAAVNRGDVLKRDVITSNAGIGYLAAVGEILAMPNADTLIVTGREIMSLIFNKIKMPVLRPILADAADAVDALDKIRASIAATEKARQDDDDDDNGDDSPKTPTAISKILAAITKTATAAGERTGDWTADDVAAARALVALVTKTADAVEAAAPVAAPVAA